MLKILGDRASGKTVRLIKEAIDNNAIFVTGDEDSEIAASGIVIEGNIFNIEIPSVAVA